MWRQSNTKRFRSSGQGLIELAAGALFLVPIVLAVLNLSTLIIAGAAIDDLAKQGARAAANAPDQPTATTAIQDIQNNFGRSQTYKDLSIQISRYDGTFEGQTTVSCTVTVVLPVPVPLLSIGPTVTIKTQSSDAIVGIAPPPPT